MPKELLILIIVILVFISGLVLGGLDKKCPDLPNPNTTLQTQVDVLKGQMKATTERYNDHGYRLQTIEDRMHIFNKEKK